MKNLMIFMIALFVSLLSFGQNNLQFGERLSVPNNSTISYKIELPQSHLYVGYADDGNGNFNIAERGTITVTCTCTGTGGACFPAASSGAVGCATKTSNPCTACSMKTTGQAAEILIDGGVIDLSAKITGITKQEMNKLPNSFHAMFELDIVKDEIKKIQDIIYPNGLPSFMTTNYIELPENYAYAPINIFGRAAMYIIPLSSIGDDNLLGVVTYGDISCSCSNSSGTCEKSSEAFGQIKTCIGSCNGCTLSASEHIHNNGPVHKIELSPNPNNGVFECKIFSNKAVNNVDVIFTSSVTGLTEITNINLVKGVNTHNINLNSNFTGPCTITVKGSHNSSEFYKNKSFTIQ